MRGKTTVDKMKIALYARVSRDDLNCENQKLQLERWAAKQEPGDEYETFMEVQTTRKTRPIKEEIMQAFRKGEIGGVCCVRLDRFARSGIELAFNVREIIEGGGRFVCINNGFDFNKRNWNATQQLQFAIFSAFAEFERELIRERTLEGLARARSQGKKLGRPKKTSPVKRGEGVPSMEALN